MGKRCPVTLFDLEFNTKAEATKWCQDLLYSSKGLEAIKGMDRFRLFALLARHPEAEQKAGAGVQDFFVDQAPSGGYGTVCFHVRRLDGTSTDFSFVTCIKGKAKTPWDDFRDAARLAVQDSLMDDKRAWFDQQGSDTAPCPETGEPITFQTAHVDHRPPMLFIEICRAYLEQRNLTPDYTWISTPADNQSRACITDPDCLAGWIAFHDEHADLQVISKTQNLRHGRKRVRSVG